MNFRTLLALAISAATIPTITVAQPQLIPPLVQSYSLNVALVDANDNVLYSETLNCTALRVCSGGKKEVGNGAQKRFLAVTAAWLGTKPVLDINYWFSLASTAGSYEPSHWMFDPRRPSVELPLQPNAWIGIPLYNTPDGSDPYATDGVRSENMPRRTREAAVRPMARLLLRVNY